MNLKKLTKDLSLDEGRKRKTYTCTAGKLSIGIGRNLEDNGLREDEIDYLFSNDVKSTIAELDHFFPWWSKMNDVRQNVLINMCFNLGITKLRMFKNTLANMRDGRYSDASKGMLNSLWARQVGNRAHRLAKEMETGKWD